MYTCTRHGQSYVSWILRNKETIMITFYFSGGKGGCRYMYQPILIFLRTCCNRIETVSLFIGTYKDNSRAVNLCICWEKQVLEIYISLWASWYFRELQCIPTSITLCIMINDIWIFVYFIVYVLDLINYINKIVIHK